MYFVNKFRKNSYKRIFKMRFSCALALTFMGIFLLHPLSPSNEVVSADDLSETAAADINLKVDAPIFRQDPDCMKISPMNLVNSYVDQLHKDLTNGYENSYSPDEMIIPDKRNTGIEENVTLKVFPESGYIGEISEEEGIAGRKPLVLTVKENESYNINGYVNPDCASRVVIENYNFEDARIYVTNDAKLPGEVVLVFKNCKLATLRSIPGPNFWIVLDHCQVEGSIYASNIIIRNSYLHSFNHDAINPISNMIVKDSYVADLLRASTAFGVHIDGVQIFGNQYGDISENVIFDNVRFSIPQIYYEGAKDYVNAAISTGLEFSEGRNFLFQNIIIDSGGRWFPIYNTGGDSVLFKNIQVGTGHHRIFYPKYVNPNARIKNTELSAGLYVSSVWKDEENRTHFLCSNNTGINKTLTVNTDQQQYTFSIKRHPTAAELTDNPKYRSYRFQDLPYDIEFIIDEDITEAVFYDGNRKIRSVQF